MRIFKCVTIFLIVLALASCSKARESQNRQSVAERREQLRLDSLALKVAVMPTLDCLPLYVAYEEELFKDQDVDVHLKLYSSQMDCDTAMIRKRVELSFTDKLRASRMIRLGTPLQYLTETNAYWQLYSNRTVRIKRLNQLGDKMVAMSRYSVTDYLTDAFLDTVKTKAQVFRIQINHVNLRLKMLLNNEMDALWLPEPQATTARINKNQLLADSRSSGDKFGVIVVAGSVNKDSRRKKQLTSFVKAYNMACDSINKYGLQHYSTAIKKYCDTDDRTIKALPRLVYTKVAPVVVASKLVNKY
uniref:SsuA/THI5-like domain-containing protein n=1 Tax=Prevotella sp. GTC17259 TaxID=3236795 RepID=A0AB33J571_9BACT